ncbi:HNH endonuclease [Sphingobium mellinum]|uniref:HNH endonuclease n=1 Tax=Sphingobium mellinum TaxID=1387166 RepID=UPI0030ED8B30
MKHLVVKTWDNPIVDTMTIGSRIAQSPEECEACGDTEGPFEMHHPNRLKDKRRDQLTSWKQSARRRRTIVLCRKCHVAHHGGRMPGRMESRVH